MKYKRRNIGFTVSSMLKKGATAGLSSSVGAIPLENTAGQASSGTRNYQNRLFQQTVRVGIAVAVMSIGIGVVRAETKPIPPMSEITAAVKQFFKDQKNYKPGDLITRDQIAPLLDRLQEMGLPLPDKKQILADLPNKKEFLVRQLSTPAGKKFMRQIARYPEAFDRVDMADSPAARTAKRSSIWIRGPDGYKMIEYMTTAAGGKELGRMLSQAPDGHNFNKPTDRIYTADLLVERLETSRKESIKAAEKKAKSLTFYQ